MIRQLLIRLVLWRLCRLHDIYWKARPGSFQERRAWRLVIRGQRFLEELYRAR